MSCMNKLFTSYGKKLGFKPQAGKEEEFERLCEELHGAKFHMKSVVFASSNPEDVHKQRQEIERITSELVAISKQSRNGLQVRR